MWITDGKESQLGKSAVKNNPDDMLNAELINELGYIIGEKLDGARYDIETICVQTGLVRFDVCGLIQVGDLLDFSFLIGDDGEKRCVDDFYLD